MSRTTITTTITTIAALAALAVSIPGSAMGQEASANSIQIEGAYAYVVNEPDAQGVQVVFKTMHALPRRSSGGIRAGGSLGSVTNGYSLSTLRGSKSKNCYVFTSATTSGRVGGPGGKRATVGSKHVLTVRRSDGEHHSDTLTVKLIKKSDANRSRARLGC